MKYPSFILIVAFSPVFAHAEIRMNGVTEEPGKGPLFVLEDTETKERASFVPLDSEFSGYVLDSYDSKTSTLILKKGEQTLSVGLASAQIKEMSPEQKASEDAQLSDEALAAKGLRRIGAGDTLGRIASQTGLKIRDIMELNPGLEPMRIKVGQIIRVRKE